MTGKRDRSGRSARRGLRGANGARTSGCPEILGPPWPLFAAGGLGRTISLVCWVFLGAHLGCRPKWACRFEHTHGLVASGARDPASGLHRDPQLDAVVRRVYQVLFCPEIPFRRLNGRVPEEQLNLLQFATCRPTHFRATAPQVMRSDARNTSRRRVLLEQLPNDLFAQAAALRLASAVHGAEYVPVNDTGRRSPRVDCYLHPSRHRDRPHAAMLANEVHDAPTPVALLYVGDCERSHLGPPQAAAEKHRQDRTITQPLGGCGVWGVQ